MTSSVPAAVEYLLGLAAQVSAGTQGAVVADGWSDQMSPVMVGVGADEPPFLFESASEVEGTQAWSGRGTQYVEEDFTVPGYVYVGAGGTLNQTVRTTAFALWDQFCVAFLADPTLGGALKHDRSADISRFRTRGPRNAEEAEGGRYCLIQFYVHCTNLIDPPPQ